jgi:hypothetical protein
MVAMVAKHLLQLLTGLGAGAACLLFLYVLGVLLTPARCADNALASPRPAVIGAAVTLLWCWYGIQLNFPLPTVMIAAICIASFLLVFRARFLIGLLGNRVAAAQLLAALAVFVLCYTIAYGFLTPSASSDFLPIARYGNNDILNYINYTSFLQRLEPSNIANYEFRRTGYPIYEATPAAFYAIHALSAFFGGEALWAAMPTIFSAVAVVGCALAWLSRIAFGLPRAAGAAAAALFVSGPFFRYLVANYFLSQIIGMTVVLLLLGETALTLRSSTDLRLRTVLWRTLPFHIVLLFCYISLFVIGAGLQLGFVFIYCIFNVPSPRLQGIAGAARTTAIWGAATICGLAAAGLADPGHLLLNLRYLGLVSQTGIAGWPLDFVSPFAVIGLPIPTQVLDGSTQLLHTGAYIGGVLFLGYMLARADRKCSAAGKAFFAIAAMSSALYFCYFLVVGPSYQQWKLASYLPLVMSFAVTSAIMVVVRSAQGEVANKREWCLGLVMVAFVALASANVAVHYVSEPKPERFSARYANLRQLEHLPGVNSLFVDMDSYSTTFFPVYFIRNKLLHLISPSYYPQEVLKPENISAATPLLVEGDVCRPDKYHMPVADVGCLFSRLTLRPHQIYHFNEKLIEASHASGLSARENWGRWSDGKKVTLTIYANEDDVVEHPAGFINFELSAFLPLPLTKQDVLIRWGQGHASQLAIFQPGWVSLPIRADDWQGDARTVTFEFDLPDAISPRLLAANNQDPRELAVGFIAMSWTEHAAGKIAD